MYLNIDWGLVLSNMTLMGVAFVFAIPIAWNRESQARSAGLRTYPLVAVASCALMLIGIKVMSSTGAEARVMQAIITGMGFIGGGAILKNKNRVIGLATATSLWTTGAMGIAVAWQRFEIALLVCLLTFFTLQFGPSAKELVKDSRRDQKH